MTKLRLLGAAAILSTVLAGPAPAQQVISDPGYCAQFYPNANCQNNGPGNPYTGSYQRRAAYQNSYNGWDDGRRSYRDRGFWPTDVAAGVAGGAVSTAAAVASAPFRGAYAYDTGNRGWYGQGYAQRNGFVCQPGTWFRGDDGLRHLCQ
jgi:hypothetical protein